LSDVHTISAPLCFLQIFCVYSYASIEALNLAVMSYDRYVAICLPLQYQALMTSKRVAVLIAVTWLFPYFSIAVLVSLSAPLPLCGNAIDRIYCGNYSIVKLSCLDTRLNNILGLLYTAVSIVLPFFMILYSYAKILEVCFSGSKQTRQKAVSTCSPHLACILNFFFGCCFQIVQSRFDLSGVPAVLAIILSLYFLTCQPLFNPLLYGLKMSGISEACKRLICGENTNN
ncbi:olfactory receptor 11A1-like, partial [Nothobranchius furzeri]